MSINPAVFVFIPMVLGHFVADFMLQPKSMALKKSQPGLEGAATCTRHCLIYTCTVCLFALNFTPIFALLVFLSHWPIDRWSLAGKWGKLIGRPTILETFGSLEVRRDIELGFAVLVYAVSDSTMHLVLLWGIANLMW